MPTWGVNTLPTQRVPKWGVVGTPSARLFQPSAALSTLLVSGSTPVTRSQVMKGLWAYIKLHNLQDQSDKNFFSPNLGMLGTFGSERIRGCSLGKYLKSHLAHLWSEENS